VAVDNTPERHQAYARIHSSPEFTELRRRFRAFVFPWTVAFLAWYLLYVVCANWAPDFMATPVVGAVNVALVFGLLQFVSTFAIAIVYSRFANRRLDATAKRLADDYHREVGA